MLNAFIDLLCSKLCWQNRLVPRHSYLYTDGKNLLTLFILILIRYAVILKCCKTDVDERLSFKDILEELNSLSNYL